MYDNLDFVLSRDSVPGIDLLHAVPPHITVTSEGCSQFGEYVNGRLGGFKVKVTEQKVSLTEGSLCKFYHGNNFKTMNRADTEAAIKQLSDMLHLPIYLSKMHRIDFAVNLLMKYQESVYYNYLGELQYYKRLQQRNGLYYQNDLRTLIFYGKVHEQKDKGNPIPDIYTGQNVLRYELRYIKGLAKQFNCPEVTAAMLYDNLFYRDMVKRWRDEYLKIQKINTKLQSMKPTGSTKVFIECVAAMSFLELGQANMLALVTEWQKRSEITKKQASDLRAKIKELTAVKTEADKNDIVLELDRKIKEVALA